MVIYIKSCLDENFQKVFLAFLKKKRKLVETTNLVADKT
jgi:hypothetical protein